MTDLKFALHQLLKNPGFTAVAVLSLALGIGACTAVFSIVNGVLLRSLPLPNPSELRVLRWADNFFSGLGAQPFIGRLFDASNAEVDAPHQVVITTTLWMEHFGRDPNVLGRTISLNGEMCTVVGVLPGGFSGVRAGDGREFYVLMTPQSPFSERAVTSVEHWWVRLMARMKPEANDAQLKAVLDVVFARDAGEQMQEPGMLVQPGRSGFAANRDQFRKPLMLMLGAVGVVMLVACVNLAGLSLARGAARQHELAIRASLGAMRWRLVRQSFSESLVLALLGGGLGGLLSAAGTNIIARLLAGAGGGLHYDTSINLTVLGFCLAVAVVTAVLSGLLPALRAGRIHPVEALKARGALDAPRLWMGRALVAGQIALSLLLLTGAGLYLRTVFNLRNIDAGFDMEKLLVFQINPAAAGYNDTQLAGYYEELQNRLAATPGVRDATLIMNPLLDNQNWSGGFSFPDRASPVGVNLQTHRLIVGERYFSTMGIPLLQGRALRTGDGAGTFKAIVVNETFARKYLPNENPIGQSVAFLHGDWQIVGVCGDTKYANLKDEAPPTAYLSFRQIPLNYRTSFAVRTALPPLGLTRVICKTVAAINPAIAVSRIVTQAQLRDGNISQERLFATLCGGLAGLALMLSCIGLYGLMAYNVARRTSEIAIRMAVGAPAGLISGSFLREALLLTAIGMGAGLPVVLAVTQLIKSQLYGLPPNDPIVLVIVTTVLLTVALLAAWLPARRAAKVDPMEALRSE